MATTGLIVIKTFPYRGVQERWSNRYVFEGTPPATSVDWRTLFDLLVAQEKLLYSAITSVVAGYGYPDGNPLSNSVWSVDMTVSPNTPVPGTLAAGSGLKIAGDQAFWVRWKLDKLNSKGKYVYLRKYFHDGLRDASNADAPYSTYQTALNAFGTKMRDGTFASGRVICDNDETLTLASGSSPYVTTRTLKRRGKRPPT